MIKNKALFLLVCFCVGFGLLSVAQQEEDERDLTIRRGIKIENSQSDKQKPLSAEPRFSIRGWESQLENFWCKWMGGSPDWFSNDQYIAYLKDAFSRAPEYKINTFMLMGRGDQGEVHTFVNYSGWDSLFLQQSSKQKQRANQQAKMLEELSSEAQRNGVGLFIWDHELQLPDRFSDLYPEARGVGAPFCPSSALVWKLLADKYEEFFQKVPSLGGIVLVFAETKFNVLEGPLCGCKLCEGKTGAYFVEKIIRTASEACQKHNKKLFVRNFGHSWMELQMVLDAIRSIGSDLPFVAMSKMVPLDFFGLQLPPDPSTTSLPERARILEDVVGGEFRGKTHNVVLPDKYYAYHLRYAADNGGSGAVFRLDHSAYPRSVFDTPNEFNVWLTSQLMVNPDQSLDKLWLQWTIKRYGSKAAPFVVKALRRTGDIWEHSTNSFGFYSTSAHGHIAPFFRGPYNAYSALWDVGDIRARSSPQMKIKFQELLNPTRTTLDEVVKERKQAVKWAAESISDLQRARPYLTADAYKELNYYMELQESAARLWCELGDMFFTGLATLKEKQFSKDLLQRLFKSSNRALLQGHKLTKKFGREWPVVPDADGRGTSLELAISGLWGELLDRTLDIKPHQSYFWENPPSKPFTWDKKRIPRSGAEQLYLSLLETAAGLGTQFIEIENNSGTQKIYFKNDSMVVENSDGNNLCLPTGIVVKGETINLKGICKLKIHSQLLDLFTIQSNRTELDIFIKAKQ